MISGIVESRFLWLERLEHSWTAPRVVKPPMSARHEISCMQGEELIAQETRHLAGGDQPWLQSVTSAVTMYRELHLGM